MSRLDDLIGIADDLAPEERVRLQRVHELLLGVPPPPDVPQRLQRPRVVPLRSRRRRYLPALVAAALLAVSFGAGYLAARNGGEEVAYSVAMSGVGAARGASATIDVLPPDEAGNYPMNVHVSGLEPNARGGDWFELWLTKDGEPIASCGRFTVAAGETTVRLSVPYSLRGYDGWIVTRRGSEEPLLTT